jgi:hypothetical protein
VPVGPIARHNLHRALEGSEFVFPQVVHHLNRELGTGLDGLCVAVPTEWARMRL